MIGARPGHSDTPDRLGRPRRSGFTLIELLVVMAIIAVLVALVIVAGSTISTRGEVRQTELLIVTLDRALEEYITETGAPPIYNPELWDETPGPNNGPQGYAGGTHVARPDAAVFIAQARGYGEVDAIVTGIDDRFLTSTEILGVDDAVIKAPSVLDAWAEESWPDSPGGGEYDIEAQQVVYYVHPQNRLAQDLYGRCKNNRPYFMSAGPDLLYGVRSSLPRTEQRPKLQRLEDQLGALSDAEQREFMNALLEDNIYSYDPEANRRDMPVDDRVWNPS